MNFRVTPRTPNHDNFGLAVLIFQLLFLGRHPFAGRYLNGEPSLGDAIKQRLFAYGSDAKNRGVVAPPSTLALEAATAFLAQLFKRAFLTDGTSKTLVTARPLPSEWLHGLEVLKQSLKVCVIHGGHYYAGQLKDCPWCEIELQSKVQLFPFSAGQAKRSQFDIEAFWKQVLEVPVLLPLGTMELKPLPVANVSPWAQVQKRLYNTGIKSLLSKVGMSKERRGAQSIARARVQEVQKSWQDLQALWKADGWETLSSRLRGEIEKLEAEYSDIEPQCQRRLNQLQKDQNQNQLQRHLDSHRIENARIDGVGSARKQTLASYGIETAADVDIHSIRNIPGFGSHLTWVLLTWRARVEQDFVFNPRQSVDPRDVQQLERETAQSRLNLERQLKETLKKLEEAYHSGNREREHLNRRAAQLRQKLAQAETNLRFL